jgi:hypothetical protein
VPILTYPDSVLSGRQNEDSLTVNRNHKKNMVKCYLLASACFLFMQLPARPPSQPCFSLAEGTLVLSIFGLVRRAVFCEHELGRAYVCIYGE